MKNRKPSAGDIIEANCTRCRSLMNHTIVAMVGEQVVKVECNTCHSVHKYREKSEKKSLSSVTAVRKAAAVQRAPKQTPVQDEGEEWKFSCDGRDRSQALAYELKGSYKVNDLLDHPVFGLGVVKTVIGPNKMEVLFQNGRKLLRCG